MSLPFVSIIVPVYNSEGMIGECIESLLKQDYPKDKYELIVVDNNSTDSTQAVIQQFPVTYIKEDSVQSSYAARNTGAKRARGEALLFFDADQVVKDDFLKRFVQDWDDQEYSAFGAQYYPLGEKNTIAGKYWHDQERLRFSNNNNGSFSKLGGGNALIRHSVFSALGGYDLNLVSWGDYDLAYRLVKAGHKIQYIDDAVIGHKERSTVKAMLKREYRIGFGRSQFDSIHEDHQESVWGVFVKAVKRTFIGVLALLWGLVKPLKNKSRKEHLSLICLDVAMRWAYLLGRLHYVFKINKGRIPAKW